MRGVLGVALVVVWCGVLHAVLLAAALDVYFRSPVVGGGGGGGGSHNHSEPLLANAASPARRVVLLVADGLRAESFALTDRTPHLKSIIYNRGTWGISQTRIPTESRPGHVAIIAGFYEDPSAITKGWKENPVEFDSLFNRSRYTWSWGSPDILPMFAKGASGDHVHTHSYSHEEEDFSGKSSTINLDTWVFNHVENFLNDAKQDNKLWTKLNQDKIILFLHLLGLDTAGHTHKPHSSQYKDNIRAVDNGIAKIENLIENFFNYDNQTAYIFTADHGMTDWGSHGAGSDHETETPFIAWGAGIATPTSRSKNLEDLKNNIFQADICPLMATLINIDIPIDSVGILPNKYLTIPIKDKVHYFHKNMRQILVQFNLKKQLIEKTAIKLIYKPFQSLTDEDIKDRLHSIEKMYNIGDFEDAINEIRKIIDLCLMGADYYQNYYQNILLSSLTTTYLGWICWLLTILLQDMQSYNKMNLINNKSKNDTFTNYLLHCIFGAILIITTFLIYVQQLPIQYYIYFSLPIFHWWKVVLSWRLWYEYFEKLSQNFNTSLCKSFVKLFSYIGIYIIGVAILIMSFFHRWCLSIGLLGLAIFPFHNSYRNKISKSLLIFWLMSSTFLAGFSFLPVIGKQDDKHLVGASGLFWFISSFVFLYKYSLPMLKSGKEAKRENVATILPMLMMIMTIQNKYFVALTFSSERGLPLISQCISWILAFLSFVIPLFTSRWIISRLFAINTSLAVFFVLLSVSHEGFFLLTLSTNLLCWLAIEHCIENNNKEIKLTEWTFERNVKTIGVNKISPIDRKLKTDDFRRSFIFLLYIILAFFGTGNIASINSFDPQWVRCFVAQFSPFTMTALILCKTLIPFMCVASTFYAVNLVVKAPTGNLFIIVLIYSDLMSLQFLHMITNKGSWLDIGTSVSHYVIMETIIFFLSILYIIGQILTETSGWSYINNDRRIRPKNL